MKKLTRLPVIILTVTFSLFPIALRAQDRVSLAGAGGASVISCAPSGRRGQTGARAGGTILSPLAVDRRCPCSTRAVAGVRSHADDDPRSPQSTHPVNPHPGPTGLAAIAPVVYPGGLRHRRHSRGIRPGPGGPARRSDGGRQPQWADDGDGLACGRFHRAGPLSELPGES